MKYRITLDINTPLQTKDGNLHIAAKHEYIDERSLAFLKKIILTTLHSFKKADKKAFYNAFARFALEDFDVAKEFTEKELNNES